MNRQVELPILIILALGLSAPVVEAAAPAHPAGAAIRESMTFTCSIEGRRWSFSVTDGDLVDSPPWNEPESQLPPISIAAAVSIAQPELKRYVANPSGWQISSVALRTLQSGAKWYYVVSWHPKEVGYRGDNIDIPVLMTGKAIIAEQRAALPEPSEKTYP